jgi:hypothetical protein
MLRLLNAMLARRHRLLGNHDGGKPRKVHACFANLFDPFPDCKGADSAD